MDYSPKGELSSSTKNEVKETPSGHSLASSSVSSTSSASPVCHAEQLVDSNDGGKDGEEGEAMMRRTEKEMPMMITLSDDEDLFQTEGKPFQLHTAMENRNRTICQEMTEDGIPFLSLYYPTMISGM